jgi:hypothetical protein
VLFAMFILLLLGSPYGPTTTTNGLPPCYGVPRGVQAMLLVGLGARMHTAHF